MLLYIEDNTRWREDMNSVFNTRNYRVMFFLSYGQKSEQANRGHRNPALVKIWKIRVFQFAVKDLQYNHIINNEMRTCIVEINITTIMWKLALM